MTEDARPRPNGRRHNGLSAQSYLPLSDVDPRVGEHLLDVLYLAGIAAYLKPTQDTDAVTRATSLPRQPSDRVWVDKTRVVEARHLLGAEAAAAGREDSDGRERVERRSEETASRADGGGRPDSGRGRRADDPADALDVDSVFAAIIAGYEQTYRRPGTTAADTGPGDTEAEDTEPGDTEAEDTGAGDGERDDGGYAGDEPADDSADPSLAGTLDEPLRAAPAGGPRDWLPGAEPPDEDSFVPPPPPPLPRISRGTAAALAIMAAGVVLLIWPGLLGLSGDLAFALPVGAIVAGVVILVWRMYDGPPVDDGPDDGAVV